MPAKAKNPVAIESPNIPYSECLAQASVTDVVMDGRLVRVAQVRLIPYRVIGGRVETREDLATVRAMNSEQKGGKKDQPLEAFVAAVDAAVQVFMDAEV